MHIPDGWIDLPTSAAAGAVAVAGVAVSARRAGAAVRDRVTSLPAVIAAYLIVTLTIGLLAGRRSSHSVTGYVAADRSFGLLVMYFVTGASVFSAFAFLGGPGWAYSRGAAAFYILAHGVLGMAPFYWIGPRVAELGRRHGYVTQAQLLTGRFPSRELSALLALLSLIAFVPYITLQMRGAGIVIEAVTEQIDLSEGDLVLTFNKTIDLMRHLRGSETRRHVREEVPFYTGARLEIADLVDRLP